MSDTIANRVPYVLMALGNRADLSTPQAGLPGTPTRIENWLWQSWLNLGMSYTFNEAEVSSQDTWSTAALAGNDFLSYPADCRVLKAITFYRSDGTPIQVKGKDMAYLRKYAKSTNAVGPPAIWAPFANKIYVRPLPDTSVYTAFFDYWQIPQLSAGPVYSTTNILVPNDWLEIVDMGAMLRGHTSLLERDKAKELQELLFGFTIPTTGKMVPGLIAQMWNRRQAQAGYIDYGIQPSQAKRAYTSQQ